MRKKSLNFSRRGKLRSQENSGKGGFHTPLNRHIIARHKNRNIDRRAASRVPWIAQAGVGCFGALQITPHARRSSRGRVFRRAPNNPPRPPLKPRRPPEATFVSLTTPAGYPLCYASSEACRPVAVRVQIFCAGRVQSARLIENRTCFQITHHLRPASLEEA